MKSYYSHLESVKSEGESLKLTQKPVFRSSAIFPVLHNEHQSTKIIFMGYWLLKRDIKEVGLLYTLRTREGEIIARKYLVVDKAKAYTIQLSEFTEINDKDFVGSIEMELFSTRDLVYPYPAFVLVYFGNNFSTAVHTVGRIYNDIEDLKSNEEYKVRESGFDIYAGKGVSPFVAITNGPLPNKAPVLSYELNNSSNEILKGECHMEPLAAFETRFIKLGDYIKLEDFLKGKPGTIKLGHNFEGFFPRCIVGNFEDNHKTISITHSYYDCSTLNDPKSYWNRKDESLNDSSVSIPLYIKDGYYTRLALYPIFSPSDFTISLQFYSLDGKLLKEISNYTELKSEESGYSQIDFGQVVKTSGLSAEKVGSVNIICNWKDKSRIPTRVKFGLNVGKENNYDTLPCNICFAPSLGNPNVLKKQGTFRWAPFINIGNSVIAFTNSSFEKKYERSANVKLSFHRQADDQTISRQLSIGPNCVYEIDLSKDFELREFFNGESGWVAAQSDNPFLNGYYFDFNENGSVGADHIF
jgi:hypothetical protein